MKYNRNENSTAVQSLGLTFGEDPYREPHEKETALHLEGDGSHFSFTSFKRVIFEKALQLPGFIPKAIHVLDTDGEEYKVKTLDEVLSDPSLTVIGVVGEVPVGAVSIGSGRNSNSQAKLVK